MGRYKKYSTDKALREAAERYFAGISRTVDVMEERRTGEKDKWGHFVKEWIQVKNDLGEPIRVREYAVPPSVGGLCASLEISRETWSRYCDGEENPKFAETTAWVREQMREYLESQLLTRSGKDLKGIIFSLQNNYGMSEKRTVELGPQAAKAVAGEPSMEEREALLRQLLEEMEPGDGYGADARPPDGGQPDGGPGEAGAYEAGTAARRAFPAPGP